MIPTAVSMLRGANSWVNDGLSGNISCKFLAFLTGCFHGLLDILPHSLGVWAFLCRCLPNVENCYQKKNKMADNSHLDGFVCIHITNAVRRESPALRRCSLLYRGLGPGFRFQESAKDLHDCDLCSSLRFAFASDFSAVLSNCCQSLGKAQSRQRHPGKSSSVKQAQEECLEDVNGRGPGFCFRMVFDSSEPLLDGF